MNALFIYMVKVAVYLTAFYLVYSLMLSRDTTYRRNRAFILVSLAGSLLIPLISFHTLKPHNIQVFGKLLSEVLITANSKGSEASGTGLSAESVLKVIYSIYITGVVIFLCKLLIDLLNLMMLIFRQKNKGSRIIRFQGFNTAGFSAMGYIFISSKISQEEACEIIRHEQNHLKQNHFIDIIFIETIIAFQWFNPVVYMFNRSLRALHEYQADQDCLRSGVEVVNYQCLLLNQVFKSGVFNLTNSFSNPSLIKKRMIMMTKKRTSAFANLKLLFVIPVTGLVFMAISAYREIPEAAIQQIMPPSVKKTLSVSLLPALDTSINTAESTLNTDKVTASPSLEIAKAFIHELPPPQPDYKEKAVEEKPAEDPYVVVEEMPMFPGGDAKLLKYIAENTTYPEAARENNIQGKVIVRFCVTAKGGVSQTSILKGVDDELDKEALRVVNTLPAFNPGKQGGKPVPVWYMVPITFALR